MNWTTNNPARSRIDEPSDVTALAKSLEDHAVWFSAPLANGLRVLQAAMPQRLRTHGLGPAACVTVDTLQPKDLPLLAEFCAQALVNQPDVLTTGFPEGQLARRLNEHGFKLFFRPGRPAPAEDRLSNRAQIGALEFLLSDPQRLSRYPTLGDNRPQRDLPDSGGARRVVVVLDLVQDFEVLRPLLALASSPGSGLDVRVAATERHVKSQLWPAVKTFLEVHELPWFTPIGPADIAAALGRERSLLLTASESTAPAHAFGYQACRAAPPRALRITLQHGLECIGLRHHRAHDLDLPHGVRFASDIVLTWDHPDRLPNLHPAETHKCITVGVVKALADRADAIADRTWLSSPPTEGLRVARAAGRSRLLIAENLHSVRFRAPARYQRFLTFIKSAAVSQDMTLTVRSHPASRTLEKMTDRNGLSFLDGALRMEDLAGFDRVVSPPSTVLLDAALAGASAAVWSDAQDFGDAAHYGGLPVVTDLSDLQRLDKQPLPGLQLAAKAWATGATAALNGVPGAWNAIQHLMKG